MSFLTKALKDGILAVGIASLLGIVRERIGNGGYSGG